MIARRQACCTDRQMPRGLGQYSAVALHESSLPQGASPQRLRNFLVSRERDFLTSGYRSRTMGYAVDCERGGSAARP